VKRSVTLLAILVVAAPLFAQSKKGEDYAPTDGRFSVRFPGKPKEKTDTAKSAIGDLKVFTATYALSDGSAYMASYTDFPEAAAKPENRNTMYDGVREGLKGKDGKVLAESAVEIGPDKLPGRDIEIENKKEKKRLKFRIVLVDNRLYQVAAIGSTNFATGKDADAFLKSFTITK
jgi:hypothetical protein